MLRNIRQSIKFDQEVSNRSYNTDKVAGNNVDR